MSPRRRLLAPICRLLGHRLDTPHAPAWWVARCSRCGEFLWGPAFESGVTR